MAMLNNQRVNHMVNQPKKRRGHIQYVKLPEGIWWLNTARVFSFYDSDLER